MKSVIVKYRVSKMKIPEFEDVLKIEKCSFHVLRVPCLLHKFRFPLKLLDYLTGRRWSAPPVLK
jgi:hypothetical protein